MMIVREKPSRCHMVPWLPCVFVASGGGGGEEGTELMLLLW